MTIEENYYSGAGAIQTPVPRLKIYVPVHGRSSTSMPMVSARGWVPVSGTGTAYQSVLSHWHTVTVTQAFLHSHTQDIRKPGFKMLTNPSPQFIRLFHKLLTQFPGEITCFKLSDTNDIRTRSQRDIQRKRKHALLPRKHAARSTRCCHWRPYAAVLERRLPIRTATGHYALKQSNCSVYLHKILSSPNLVYFLLNTQRSTRRTAQIWSETFDKKSALHFIICPSTPWSATGYNEHSMECNGI